MHIFKSCFSDIELENITYTPFEGPEIWLLEMKMGISFTSKGVSSILAKEVLFQADDGRVHPQNYATSIHPLLWELNIRAFKQYKICSRIHVSSVKNCQKVCQWICLCVLLWSYLYKGCHMISKTFLLSNGMRLISMFFKILGHQCKVCVQSFWLLRTNNTLL